jgi:hypothetical protein
MSNDPVVLHSLIVPDITDETESLTVDFPELRCLPIGRRVYFMVGAEDVVFVVTDHERDVTHLTRVRDAKG